MEIRTRQHSRRWRRVSARLSLTAVVFAIVLLAPAALGLSQHAVDDEAMAGSVSRGSLVFERPVREIDELQVGDVITFPAPGIPGVEGKVTRRVVAIEGNRVRTRGDALPGADPWTLRTRTAEPSRMVFSVPFAGYPQLLVPGLTWTALALLLAVAALASAVAARLEAGRLHRPATAL